MGLLLFPCKRTDDIVHSLQGARKGTDLGMVHHAAEVFESEVEQTLVQPTYVIDHPAEISPLAKPHRAKPGLVERFELFIYGAALRHAQLP